MSWQRKIKVFKKQKMKKKRNWKIKNKIVQKNQRKIKLIARRVTKKNRMKNQLRTMQSMIYRPQMMNQKITNQILIYQLIVWILVLLK